MSYNRINRYLPKAVYIRETLGGKTKWIKLPGVTARNGHGQLTIVLDQHLFEEEDRSSYYQYDKILFVREGRAE